jgi:hypothetical protein
MNNAIKKLNGKSIKNILVLLALSSLLVYVIIDTDGGNDAPTIEKAVNVGIAKAKVKNQFANTPKRFNSAPKYSEGHEAAKIIHQAIDPKEANHFIYLKVSERNLKLQSTIAALEADIAIKNAEKAKAEKQISNLSDKNIVTSSFSMNNEVPASMGDGIVSYNEQGQAINSNKNVNSIRIIGWSSKDKITASLKMSYGNENTTEFAENIRIKQVLWGRYKIEGIDENLKCINIYDAKNNKALPNVCYN